MLKRVVVMLATVVAGLLAPTMAATQTPMTDRRVGFGSRWKKPRVIVGAASRATCFSLTRWRHSAYRRMDA